MITPNHHPIRSLHGSRRRSHCAAAAARYNLSQSTISLAVMQTKVELAHTNYDYSFVVAPAWILLSRVREVAQSVILLQ